MVCPIPQGGHNRLHSTAVETTNVYKVTLTRVSVKGRWQLTQMLSGVHDWCRPDTTSSCVPRTHTQSSLHNTNCSYKQRSLIITTINTTTRTLPELFQVSPRSPYLWSQNSGNWWRSICLLVYKGAAALLWAVSWWIKKRWCPVNDSPWLTSRLWVTFRDLH